MAYLVNFRAAVRKEGLLTRLIDFMEWIIVFVITVERLHKEGKFVSLFSVTE